MTCIYFSVSLKVSKSEFKILGKSYVTFFKIRPQRPPQNYVVGHIANQDLATRGAPIPRMRAHRERQRRNAPSARKNRVNFVK